MGSAAGYHAPATAKHRRRQLLFHTFSNTGWMGYGKVLQQLYEKLGREAVDGAVRGCIVDSAPMLKQDPDVSQRVSLPLLVPEKKEGVRICMLPSTCSGDT